MKILVTGARGMLGSDVMLAAENAGHEVRGFGHRELDITDADAVMDRVTLERPDVVINCAAWTDVDGANETGDQNIIAGIKQIAGERKKQLSAGRSAQQ